MNGYYTKSQKSSEKESTITAIPFICDSISNILCRNLGQCIRYTPAPAYFNTEKNC